MTQFRSQEKNMSLIKDTMSNLFSKNKKKGEEGTSELEKEVGIQQEPEHEAGIENESKTDGGEEHENEFQNNTTIREDIDPDPDPDPEWERRILCSDGNCIGVIGPDGLCKECGKPYEGTEQISDHEDNQEEIFDPPSPHEGLIDDEENFLSENPEEVNNTSDESGTDSDSESESEWDKRILCSDGNCIGVIGPDGRCKECGKPYEG